MNQEEIEDLIEASYWRFDARHKGIGPWKLRPQTERDAFKWEVRAILSLLRPAEHEDATAK